MKSGYRSQYAASFTITLAGPSSIPAIRAAAEADYRVSWPSDMPFTMRKNGNTKMRDDFAMMKPMSQVAPYPPRA